MGAFSSWRNSYRVGAYKIPHKAKGEYGNHPLVPNIKRETMAGVKVRGLKSYQVLESKERKRERI